MIVINISHPTTSQSQSHHTSSSKHHLPTISLPIHPNSSTLVRNNRSNSANSSRSRRLDLPIRDLADGRSGGAGCDDRRGSNARGWGSGGSVGVRSNGHGGVAAVGVERCGGKSSGCLDDGCADGFAGGDGG